MATASLFFPNYVGTIIGGDGQTVTQDMNQAVVNVAGMTCEGCAIHVAQAIRTAPGVLAVEVDYETGKALVGTEPCCPLPRQNILTALDNAGYPGTFSASNASPLSSPDAAQGK